MLAMVRSPGKVDDAAHVEGAVGLQFIGGVLYGEGALQIYLSTKDGSAAHCSMYPGE